jgi:hypothetical protein
VFSSEFERTAVPVKLFDSDRSRADHGEIARAAQHTVERGRTGTENGRRERLYELAIALNEAIPVSLEAETKAARAIGWRRARAGLLPRRVKIRRPT